MTLPTEIEVYQSKRINRFLLLITLIVFTVSLLYIASELKQFFHKYNQKLSYFEETLDVIQIKSDNKQNTHIINKQSGVILTASWYDTEHCINCHPERIMANGEALDDSVATVAYDHTNLNDYILVCDYPNEITCLEIQVTDRIGRKDRIDMTPPLFTQFAPLNKGLTEVIVYTDY